MARRLIPAAVLRNPRSAGNARGRSPRLPLPTASPNGPMELRQTLEGLRRDGVELLAIQGGDGTVRETVTALVAVGWGPRLAILPAGKINLTAGDVGTRPEKVMRLLGEGWGGETILRRPLLRLSRAGHPPVFGMFAGAAVFTRAADFANRHLHPRRIDSGLAVAAAMAATLARYRRAGTPMAVSVDGAPAVGGRHFLVLATTLERLSFGLWPFADQGVGGLHWLDMDAPPRHLVPALFGRTAEGLRSGEAFRLSLETTEPLVLDGEPFAPGTEGRMELSAGPVVEFVRP